MTNITLAGLAAKATADTLVRAYGWKVSDFLPSQRARRRKNLEQEQVRIIKELSKSGISVELYDRLLTQSLNRHLKQQFGIIFLILTFLFTAASYIIVACDGIFGWDISDVAITALIVQAPIQFVGLLYIIARNLFGDGPAGSVEESLADLEESE